MHKIKRLEERILELEERIKIPVIFVKSHNIKPNKGFDSCPVDCLKKTDIIAFARTDKTGTNVKSGFSVLEWDG